MYVHYIVAREILNNLCQQYKTQLNDDGALKKSRGIHTANYHTC